VLGLVDDRLDVVLALDLDGTLVDDLLLDERLVADHALGLVHDLVAERHVLHGHDGRGNDRRSDDGDDASVDDRGNVARQRRGGVGAEAGADDGRGVVAAVKVLVILLGLLAQHLFLLPGGLVLVLEGLLLLLGHFRRHSVLIFVCLVSA
jgi:hypothetical protein